MTFPAPSPTYLGPAAQYSPGGNKPIRRIVIHSTVGPTRAGSARGIASYFRNTDRYASAHYAVDAREVVQCVFDGDVAYHAPPNTHSLGVELCDYPHPSSMKRWEDDDHKAMFKLATRLVAELCLAYDVRPWFVGPIRLRLGWRGVTTHAAVRDAWGQTDHWDPGMWPRRAFMREVRAQCKAIRKAAK